MSTAAPAAPWISRTDNADIATCLSAGSDPGTERLILRPTVAEDFDGFCAFHADENTMTYLGGVLPPPVVWRNMRSMAGAWALDGFSMFSVIEKTSGDWIGRIGPIFPKDWPGREVGWGLLSRYWGKGYAREAAIASMDFVFDTLGWEDVIHSIDARNDGSAAVARSLGSYLMREARLPPPFESYIVDIWGQTRDEWRGNRTRLMGAVKVS